MPDPRFAWLYPHPPSIDAAIDRLKAEVLELPDPEATKAEMERLLQIRAQTQLLTELEARRVAQAIDTPEHHAQVAACWDVLEGLGVQRPHPNDR